MQAEFKHALHGIMKRMFFPLAKRKKTPAASLAMCEAQNGRGGLRLGTWNSVEQQSMF